MRIRLLAVVAFATLIASCAPYSDLGGGTYFGFTVTGVTGAPPPPRVHVVRRDDDYGDYDQVAGSSVYIVRDPGEDCDVFLYGSSFYMYYGGYWYRSSQPTATFVAIDVHSVPRQVLQVPEEHWRHHPHGGPPGQMKKQHGWDHNPG
jgi:hypothetical protein